MPQQTYTVTDPTSGRKVKLTGDSPPTEAELNQIFATINRGSTPQPTITPGASPLTAQREASRQLWGTDDPTVPTAEPPQTSLLTRIIAQAFGVPSDLAGAALDVAKGGAKSVLGTIEGGGKLIRQIPVVGPALDRAGSVTLPVSTRPSNPMQTAGKVAGDVAQFVAPSGAVGKAKALATTGRAVTDALIGAGLEGATAGAISAAQTGEAGAGTTTGIVTAALSGATPVGRAAFKALGERTERALVKATQRDVQNGFKAANIFKYDLGGTLEQTYQKTADKLNDLSGQLKTAVTMVKPGGQVQSIDLFGALDRAAKRVAAEPAKTVGQNQAMASAVNKLLAELDPVLAKAGDEATKTAKVDLWTANQLKQGVGDLGAWVHDPTGRVATADDKAMETVANAFYDELKKEIEAKAVGPVKYINAQLSDLIAIRQAVARRIPVELRQNVLNLGDLIGFGTGHWGLSMANRLLKSGQAANLMNTIRTGTSQMPARVAGAMTSEGAQ